jgi:hypothetical protein
MIKEKEWDQMQKDKQKRAGKYGQTQPEHLQEGSGELDTVG